MNKKTGIILILILLSGVVYYYLSGPKFQLIETSLIQAVDGDTIDTELGRVRLLGINTPEKNQPFYNEAKDFLSWYESKRVKVALIGKDKYGRWLGYLFFNGELVNKKILEKGLANLYVYDKDSNFNDLESAENYARQNENGIWKKSGNYGCLSIVSFRYLDEDYEENKEQLILNNSCKEFAVIIKDDANHIYDENISSGLWQKNFSHIWNDEGDTIFIRDESGLILFWRY
jgi:micrococcal nuclease